MMCKPVPCDLFPFRSLLTIIAVRINGDSATWKEFSPYFNIFRLHQLYQIIHDNVHAVLMEIAVIAETEKIQFQRFALDHALIWHVGNIYRRKVGLSCDRAKAGEFGTVELDEVVSVRVLVRESFKDFGTVI